MNGVVKVVLAVLAAVAGALGLLAGVFSVVGAGLLIGGGMGMLLVVSERG